MNTTPLAALLRPNDLNGIFGQSHLLDEGMPLRKMVQNNKFQSIIFWGPPGVGKTSIVRCLAKESDSIFRQLNATNASVKELRTIIKEAQEALKAERRTFVFIDEIHRWNKAQQDTMLPVVEDGTIVLFGATTERPKFAVNSTLLSRCLVLEVKPLNDKGMIDLIMRVRTHYKALDREIKFDKNATRMLINRCSGDARKMITALETIIEILSDDGFISEDLVNQAIPDKHLVFDANGNDHFDLAHCYQEAIQNSDVDGAIYWLAKWISSGEDPAYICRRMLITAFEDCAANPFAATTAMAAAFTAERTGLPECMIPMALATCEMAMSERNKSAYHAIKEAMADVENGSTVHVPPELRAGSNGYIKAVNKTYLKGWTR
jgi:putative ATPase